MSLCDTIVPYFRIVCLSMLSMPTLCLKDPQTRNDSVFPEIFLMVGVIHGNKVRWVLATQKQEKLSVNNFESFIVRCSNCIQYQERERERERERESVRVYEQTQRDT